MASPKRLHKHPPSSLFNLTTTFDHHHHLVEKPLYMDDFMMMRNFITAENNNNEQQQTSSLLSSSSSSSTASFSLMQQQQQQQQTLNNKKKSSSSPTPCPEEEVLNDLVVVVKQDQDSLMNDHESSLHPHPRPHPHQDNNNVGGGSGGGHDNGNGGTNEEEALSQRPTPIFGGEMMAQDYLRTVNININQRPPQLNAMNHPIVTQAEWLHFQMVAQQPQMDAAAMGSHLVAPPLFGNPIRDVVGYSDNRFVPSMAMIAGSSSLASHSILDRKRRFSDEMMEKTIERRQKRMIKNRESAARSRQKKQAYTITMETNIAHLKELNQKLEKELEIDRFFTTNTKKTKYQLRRTSSAMF